MGSGDIHPIEINDKTSIDIGLAGTVCRPPLYIQSQLYGSIVYLSIRFNPEPQHIVNSQLYISCHGSLIVLMLLRLRYSLVLRLRWSIWGVWPYRRPSPQTYNPKVVGSCPGHCLVSLSKILYQHCFSLYMCMSLHKAYLRCVNIVFICSYQRTSEKVYLAKDKIQKTGA